MFSYAAQYTAENGTSRQRVRVRPRQRDATPCCLTITLIPSHVVAKASLDDAGILLPEFDADLVGDAKDCNRVRKSSMGEIAEVANVLAKAPATRGASVSFSIGIECRKWSYPTK